jgi:CDP-diacylglycerol--glycerol-3-phosphate 3-phosphatidyltransferase
MSHVPNLLSLSRLAMVPVLAALAWTGHTTLFLVAFVASLLSDVVDGWLARRFGVTTPLGSKLDSWGDMALYTTLPLFAWWLWPDILRAQALPLGIALAAYFLPTAIGLLRFRRITSYHTWGAKATSVVMGGAALCLFLGGPAWPFQLAVLLLVAEAIEEIAITFVLRRRHNDVPTLWHAFMLRYDDTAAQPARKDSSSSPSTFAFTVRRSMPSRRAVSS